jgi:uncharacterized protein (DUF169 family)
MLPLAQVETRFNGGLGLTRRPVAINFFDDPPAGMSKFTGSMPSGCSFWRLAAEGRKFYTVPSDHYNCPIGSHTHSISLPAERQNELPQALSLMGEIGYIRMEEVGKIPTLPKQPNIISYAPLSDAPAQPDVVIFAGKPGTIMLLMEAAQRAGIAGHAPMFGRPTCMAIPAAMQGGVASSTACIGNRVYTEIGDDDIYVAVPGMQVEKLAAELDTILAANNTLREYHRNRKQALTKD